MHYETRCGDLVKVLFWDGGELQPQRLHHRPMRDELGQLAPSILP